MLISIWTLLLFLSSFNLPTLAGQGWTHLFVVSECRWRSETWLVTANGPFPPQQTNCQALHMKKGLKMQLADVHVMPAMWVSGEWDPWITDMQKNTYVMCRVRSWKHLQRSMQCYRYLHLKLLFEMLICIWSPPKNLQFHQETNSISKFSISILETFVHTALTCTPSLKPFFFYINQCCSMLLYHHE